MNKFNIAILDDDATHTQLIEQALTGGHDEPHLHFSCSTFSCGRDFLLAIKTQTFDCLIMDRQLPDITGDQLLSYIRTNISTELPAIIVSSLSGTDQVNALLSAGANDYLTKPFLGADLFARVQSLLERRSGVLTHKSPYAHLLQFTLHGVIMDRFNLTICHHDCEAACTPREFALVEFLLNNHNRALSRTDIYEAVWQRRAVSSSRAVDTLIHRIRIKLKLEPTHGFALLPIYGFGYRLDLLE